MTSRERLLTTLTGGIPDRVGRTDSPWAETIVRWKQEGLGEDQDVYDLFGFDFSGLPWPDCSFRFPAEIIEDTDEYVIQKDGNGVTRKDFKRESGHTPHWMDHTLKTSADWFEHKPRLVPMDERVPGNLKETYDTGRARDSFITMGMLDPYECIWPVLGQVGIFTMMMDEPEVVGDIFDTYANLVIAMAQKFLDAGIDYDAAWMYGDLGYRNGTLFSPEIYKELLLPAHKKMCDFFKSKGKPVLLHSCGKIKTLIPYFIEAGYSAIQPLEAKCDQDVRELKQQFANKITLFGNIDVRKLSGTKQDVEEEITSKVPVAMKGGGYIFHSDHSVPPTVSFENYCYAIELMEKYGKY